MAPHVPDPRRLNIGAGLTYIPGFTNIDTVDRADIVADLDHERLPFASDSVDTVFTYHTLEHLTNYLHGLGEIHRVMTHGARLFVGVPYVTSTLFNLVNPYHRQNFSEHSFDFFDPQRLVGSAAERVTIRFRKIFHRFHYFPEFADKPEPEREWSRRHLFNVVSRIDFGLVALKHESDAPADEAELTAEFDRLLASRVRYGREIKGDAGP